MSDKNSASVTPMTIGTSMLSRRAARAEKAERRKGLPAYAAAGSAMSADSQWKKSRVSDEMPDALPDQTETDNSMTFIIAKPATASERSSSLPAASASPRTVAGSKGWAR